MEMFGCGRECVNVGSEVYVDLSVLVPRYECRRFGDLSLLLTRIWTRRGHPAKTRRHGLVLRGRMDDCGPKASRPGCSFWIGSALGIPSSVIFVLVTATSMSLSIHQELVIRY